jgi:hypothetical protein
MATVSKFKVSEALWSAASLARTINGLTEQEVLACLDLEAAAQRRASILDRLISRAARLNEIKYVRQLKEKYHGKENHPS